MDVPLKNTTVYEKSEELFFYLLHYLTYAQDGKFWFLLLKEIKNWLKHCV